MTYLQEIELQLQTAEKIDEQMQHNASMQMFFAIIGILLAALMIPLDNFNCRIALLIPIFWTMYWQIQKYRKVRADAKVILGLTDRVELLLRNPALDMSILSKEIYALRISRLKP